MITLDEIGFYTLSENRAKNISSTSPMWRGELLITDRCNFRCAYCRGLREDCRGDITREDAFKIIDIWCKNNLKHIRFSGGEPTLHPYLFDFVKRARNKGVKRIAISTNGSAKLAYYLELIKEGVNDFSISLDGCCAADIDFMSGKSNCKVGNTIIQNIRELSKRTYVTTGVVITNDNLSKLVDIVNFAHDLGVADIRIISAAQENRVLVEALKISENVLNDCPILKYRVNNIKNGVSVRGMKENDCRKCYLMMDDSVIAGNMAFPCIIYLREGGNAICEVSENMREKRIEWMNNHNTFEDPICRKNCLDACVMLNNRIKEYKNGTETE
jgi:MoaA/NifB/PqqE/SkfB family radical SAM enzyme